jgi:hypothetical protein
VQSVECAVCMQWSQSTTLSWGTAPRVIPPLMTAPGTLHGPLYNVCGSQVPSSTESLLFTGHSFWVFEDGVCAACCYLLQQLAGTMQASDHMTDDRACIPSDHIGQ